MYGWNICGYISTVTLMMSMQSLAICIDLSDKVSIITLNTLFNILEGTFS
jgi:hypothetical protein